MNTKLNSFLLIFLLLMYNSTSFALPSPVIETQQVRTIGVLALNGISQSHQEWGGLIEFINQQDCHHHFKLQPLNFEDIETAVQQGNIDYLIANSAYYVLLEKRYHLFRTATLTKTINQHAINQFGGVIIAAPTIDQFDALGNEALRIGAVNDHSLGGYLVQRSIVQQALGRDVTPDQVQFFNNHLEVIKAVESRQVDIGFARTGTLEKQFSSKELNVLVPPTIQENRFPFAVSTPLYPEWPFASLAHIDQQEASLLTSWLLKWRTTQLTTHGEVEVAWSVPLNYQPVHELLKHFNLPPYEKTIRFQDWLAAYWQLLTALILILVGLSGLTLILLHKNQENRKLRLHLTKELDNFNNVVNKNRTGILIFDPKGVIRFANAAAEKLLDHPISAVIQSQLSQPLHLHNNSHKEFSIIRHDGELGVAELNVTETEWQGEKAYLALIYDITELKQAKEAIKHQATHDPLTGLPNRRLFNENIAKMQLRAVYQHTQFALLFLDLDRFKQINDTLGHTIGDELLIQVANRIQTTLRATDRLARIGGDEFTILVENLQTLEDAEIIAQKICARSEEHYQIGAHSIHSKVSIGISVFPKHSDQIDELIKMADMAMYYTKQHKHLDYCFYQAKQNLKSHNTHGNGKSESNLLLTPCESGLEPNQMPK